MRLRELDRERRRERKTCEAGGLHSWDRETMSCRKCGAADPLPNRYARQKRHAPEMNGSSPSNVKRAGRFVGTPMHYAGANWHVIDEAPNGNGSTVLELRRMQDGAVEEHVPLVKCSRPSWYKGER
jgi:hypothetical protein